MAKLELGAPIESSGTQPTLLHPWLHQPEAPCWQGSPERFYKTSSVLTPFWPHVSLECLLLPAPSLHDSENFKILPLLGLGGFCWVWSGAYL